MALLKSFAKSLESRTIIWVSHLNRFLRCAKENLPPVSMREFEQHATFVQTSTPEQVQNMASRPQQQLQSRSGLFQYRDLSGIGPSYNPEEENEGPIDNDSLENAVLEQTN